MSIWQSKFSSKNKLMLAPLIRQLPFQKTKKLIKQLDPIVKDIIS